MNPGPADVCRDPIAVREYLAGGMTVAELLADFPELTVEDVRACLGYDFGRWPGSVA